MKKYHNIECLRFLFSIIIVYFHILHSNIFPYVGEHPVYLDLKEMCVLAGRIVECFLVIAGFFLCLSCQKKDTKPFAEYFLGRVVRLWPVLAFYTLVTLLMGGKFTEDVVLDLVFLRSTGISLAYKGIIWYVGPFFWSCLLLYAILTNFERGKASILIAVIAYFGYAINLNYCSGGLGRGVIWTFVDLGMLRVLAGLGIGILLGMGWSAFSRLYSGDSSCTWFQSIFFTVLETVCLAALLLIFLTKRLVVKNAFTVVVLFSILLICFVMDRGFLSRILNRPLWGKLGKYAYSIYVMQQISFNILAKTFWQHKGFICRYEVVTIFASVAFSVGVGILTYHLIEQPAFLLFKKWENAHTRHNT